MNSSSIDCIESLYLYSPTLEYNQAFNLATANWEFRDEPIRVVMSSAVYAVELLKRCQGPLHFSGSGEFDADLFVAQIQDWAWGPVRALPLISKGQLYNAFIWAEPEVSSAENILRYLSQIAAPGASLRIISSALLYRFLPVWQSAPYPAIQPLLQYRIGQLLSATGWTIGQKISFHGPRSILWNCLSQIAMRLGRLDWSDRCLLAMRGVYHEPGWLWPAATLTLIMASRS